MNRTIINAAFFVLFVFTTNFSQVFAAGISKPDYVPPNNVTRVSDRLIVKLRPNTLPKGLSVAQISTELSRPFTAQAINQIQTAAGVNISEIHSLSNGAHVFSIPGTPNKQTMAQAIAGISRLADVEYVEEDTILTIQIAPNDTYYTTGPSGNPGLWGMKPVTSVTLPAPGATGSYGADFEAAWATSTGTGVVVAVVDTGITPHVDIVGSGGTVLSASGNLVSSGYDFITDCRVRGTCSATTATVSAVVAPSADATDLGDFISNADSTTTGSIFFGLTAKNSSWHGTHVAGTIAAIGNNSAGVIGGAYNAKILPVRVLGKGGGYSSDIAEGIKWAAGVHATIPNPNPAKVINMSLGSYGTAGTVCSPTRQAAIDAAVAAGAVVVVAAGNSYSDVANATPANCNNVISVAAIARDGSRALYSNFSSPTTNTANPINITLAAQGGDQSYSASYDPGILSTLNSSTTTTAIQSGSNYIYYQGTSMATPHVAATVALMRARNPALTVAQVKTIISAPASLTAFPYFQAGYATYDCYLKQNCGAGILNANLAVQNSITPLTASSSPADFGSILTNSTGSKTVTFTNSSQGTLTTGVIAITGGNSTLFTVVTNTCNSSSIVPQGTCQITINYAPTVAGNHSATLSVPTSVAGVSTTVGLTGVAGSSLTTSTPTVTATTVNVGKSTTVNLSFGNPNATSVKTSVVTFSQPAIMAASVNNCSNVTLAANSTCSVTVTITPAVVGDYSGTASVSLSGGGTPTQATITGSATAAPAAGGGGGCSVMPTDAYSDLSLPLTILVMLAYWLRQRERRTSKQLSC